MGYIACDQSLRASGAEGSRTPDLLNAIQALSQLSYSPVSIDCLANQALISGLRRAKAAWFAVVELRGLEPLASSVRLMRSPS